ADRGSRSLTFRSIAISGLLPWLKVPWRSPGGTATKIRTGVALVVCALAPSAASIGPDPAPDESSASPFAASEPPPTYEPSSMTRPVLRSRPNGKQGPGYSAADREAGIEGSRSSGLVRRRGTVARPEGWPECLGPTTCHDRALRTLPFA